MTIGDLGMENSLQLFSFALIFLAFAILLIATWPRSKK